MRSCAAELFRVNIETGTDIRRETYLCPQFCIYIMKFYFLFFILLLGSFPGFGQDSLSQRVNLHFQSTYIYQYKPAFSAEYSGPNSIGNAMEKQNSVTATMFIGVRLWRGAEVYINPEIAGGSGLSGAFGMSASTNGESFRVGDPSPTLYLARGVFKQTFALGNKYDTLDENVVNQLRCRDPRRFIRICIGKFSLGDYFDNNDCSSSPRNQFMNWALMSNSAWDYAANLRGYTEGFVGILQWDKMSYKIGVVTEPLVANGPDLNTDFSKARGTNVEVDRTYSLRGQGGHIRLLGYYNVANMGTYKTALQNAIDSGNTPNVIATRKDGNTKTGLGLNADQHLADYLSLFARIGWNDGKTESWAFTEADRTLSVGASLSGLKWKRKEDVIGLAFVANGLSDDHKNYLAKGGLGFQLGDGKLNYGHEMVTELYYSCKTTASGIWVSGDYQFAMNPGYNKDRGPLQVFSLRVHVEL